METGADNVRWEDGTVRQTVPIYQRTLDALAAQIQEGNVVQQRKASEKNTVTGKRNREMELVTLLGTGKGSIMGARKTGLTAFELDDLLDHYNFPAGGRGNKAQKQEKAKELVEQELNELRSELAGEGGGAMPMPTAVAELVVASAQVEVAPAEVEASTAAAPPAAPAEVDPAPPAPPAAPVEHTDASAPLPLPAGLDEAGAVPLPPPDSIMNVVVPEGYTAGTTFTAALPDGNLINVTVPPGAGPGEVIQVAALPPTVG